MTHLDHDEFVRRLIKATPRLWATKLIIGLNVLVWLLNLATGMSPTSPVSTSANSEPLTFSTPVIELTNPPRE